MAGASQPPYEFINITKNCKPGILVTHNCMRYRKKRQKNDTFYFRCVQSDIIGCNASAVVQKIKVGIDVRFVLAKWTNLEGHNNSGDYGGVIAEKMLLEMTQHLEVNLNLWNISVVTGTAGLMPSQIKSYCIRLKDSHEIMNI